MAVVDSDLLLLDIRDKPKSQTLQVQSLFTNTFRLKLRLKINGINYK